MKYWVYIQGEVPGSYTPAELAGIKDFRETSMVCPAEEGLADRNWQRAGQFPDIVASLRKAAAKTPPPSPEAPMPELSEAADILPKNPNEVLNDASTRIFTHVSELMKELENRREERALTQSLQRQLSELKNELLALRERNQHLQGQVEMIPGFEEREKRSLEKIARLQSDIMERDERLGGLDKQNESLRGENERVKRAEDQLSGDLRRQRALGEELTKHLAGKEFTLAKAFGIIRKLEAMLGEILPEATVGMTTLLPGYADQGAQERQELAAQLSDSSEQPTPSEVAETIPAAESPVPSPAPSPEPAPTSAPSAASTVPSPAPSPESSVPEDSAQEAEQSSPEAQPETVSEDRPSAYTADSDTPVPDETAELEGKPEEVPAPWQSAVEKIRGLFGSKE